MLYDQWKHKTPIGAVRQKELISISFPSPDAQIQSVRLCVRDFYSTQKFFVEGKKEGNTFRFALSIEETGIYYYLFIASTPDKQLFYGSDDNGVCRQNCDKEWQITVYCKDYVAPTSAKGGIIYHIFVDRFAKLGEIKIPKYGVLKEWGQDVDVQAPYVEYKANDFFGGNLKGIISKLDYLQSLGVTVLYLSPIFQAFSNHRYDTADYMKIDPLIGNELDFDELIRKADKLGISVILDGVFNHSGSDSVYFNKDGHYDSLGAYQSLKSPYHDWYCFEHFPNRYKSWWGCTVLPTFNKNSVGYRNLLFSKYGVLEKWTKRGILGWRLDVVDELPIEIASMVFDKIKQVNPQAYVIGEVWEDASIKECYGELKPYFTRMQLDGVMNYPYMNAIIDYTIHCNSALFRQRVMALVNNYPFDCLLNSMIMLGSHDTRRILNVLSEINVEGLSQVEKKGLKIPPYALALAKKRLLVASILEFTLPGIPTIYYGDEAGMIGERDPLNRMCYPWGDEDEQIVSHYKKLGKIRSLFKEAMVANITFELIDDMVVFHRGEDEGRLTVIANSGKRYCEIRLDSDRVDLITGEILHKGVAIIEPIRGYVLQDID